jgi:hypothetical protein
LKDLILFFNHLDDTSNLDILLDAIFSLDQLVIISLRWNRMSVEKIKSSMKRHGGTKRSTYFRLCGIDRAMNEVDILEICSFLPELEYWVVKVSDLTVDGAKEWKRICPNLKSIELLFSGGGGSKEVKEELRGLGLRVGRM